MLFASLAVVVLLMAPPPALGQRIQPADLVYLGAFRLPDGSNGTDWTYSGYGMTHYPGGDPTGPDDGYPGSLFAIGNDQQQLVSEISIPAPVISPTKNVNDLPTATTLQPFRDITGGMFGPLELPRADLEYLPAQGSQTSGKIHFCWGQHFQFDQVPSHGWCELDLSDPQSAGAWYFGNYSNYVTNDYLFEIPTDWAAANTPGQRLATGRFRDGSWGGQGPALFAYGPWNDGNPPAANARLTSLTPLLLYGVQTPGAAEITNDPSMKMATYKEPDEWSGGAWLAAGANAAVVLAGTKALGRSWYGFSNGVEYPTSDEPGTVYPEVPPWPHDQRGWWSEDIEAQLIFYDPGDLAAVAAGSKQPYEPQPYATFALDSYLFDPGFDHERHKRYLVGDISFDRQRGYLYLIERMADEDKSIVHVFAVQSSSTSNSFRLYFPHIASNATWETEIAIINTDTSATLTGTLKAHTDSGQELTPSTAITLPALGRKQITVGADTPTPSSIGYLILECSSDHAQGYTKFYQSGIYRVAIPAVKEINTADLYVSHIASNQDWWTGVSLLNTTSQPVQLTIEFDNGTSVPLTLNANQHYKNTVEQLLGGQPQPDIHSAVIRTGSGVIGLELFGNTTSQAARRLEGILLTDDTTTTLYYPLVASDATWWTGIVAYNPAPSATTLSLRPYTTSGNSLATAFVPLNAGEKYLGTAELLGLPAETAWLRINASSAITGFELVGTRDGSRLAGYFNLASGSRQGVLPKLEKQGTTRIALVNIEDAAAAVTLAAYNDASTLVATTQLPLASHQKVFDDAQDFFQQSISTATYLAYSADRNLVAYQLNNSTDNALLDGLPALGEKTLPDAPLPLLDRPSIPRHHIHPSPAIPDSSR